MDKKIKCSDKIHFGYSDKNKLHKIYWDDLRHNNIPVEHFGKDLYKNKLHKMYWDDLYHNHIPIEYFEEEL